MKPSRVEQGYNHGRHLMVFYKGLALHPEYVEGFMEGCLHRLAEDRPSEAWTLRKSLQDPDLHGHVLEVLKGECDVRAGRGKGAV